MHRNNVLIESGLLKPFEDYLSFFRENRMQSVDLNKLIIEIQSLPIHAQQSFVDFVDFLKYKYADELDHSFLSTKKIQVNQTNLFID